MGQNINLEEDNECNTRKMFHGPVVRLADIVHKGDELRSTDDAEEFCKLYILLALNELYFPNTSCIVS